MSTLHWTSVRYQLVQGWARSQKWDKKVIRYKLISIWYNTIWKWQFSERYHLNFDTEIIKNFVFWMWTVIIRDIILYTKYQFHLIFHTESNLDFAPVWLKIFGFISFLVQNYQFNIFSSTNQELKHVTM